MTASVLNPTEAIEHYDRDGYVIFRDVIDPELVAEASDHVAWLQRRHPELRPEQLGHEFLRDDPFWVRLISDDRLLDIAELFVGPDIALFASHYIAKPPFSGPAGAVAPGRRASGRWTPMEVVTLWLAVDHSTPENGCVRLIPGTHRMEFAGVQGQHRDRQRARQGDRRRGRRVQGGRHRAARPATSRCTTPTSCTAATANTSPTGGRPHDPLHPHDHPHHRGRAAVPERLPAARPARRQRLPAGAHLRGGPPFPLPRWCPGLIHGPAATRRRALAADGVLRLRLD